MTPPRLIRINCNQLSKYLYSPRLSWVSPERELFAPSFLEVLLVPQTKKKEVITLSKQNDQVGWSVVILRRHLKARHTPVRDTALPID